MYLQGARSKILIFSKMSHYKVPHPDGYFGRPEPESQIEDSEEDKTTLYI